MAKSPSNRYFRLPEYCLPVGREAVRIIGMWEMVYTDFLYVFRRRSVLQMQKIDFVLQNQILQLCRWVIAKFK